MSYVPNPFDNLEPTESRTVESAAQEFRILKEPVIRSLRFPASDSPAYRGELPAAASRAGRFLVFDAITGKPVPGPLLNEWVPGQPASFATVTDQFFSGTAVTTTFLLNSSPGNQASVEVFISGVRQRAGLDYTLNSVTLEFTTAPPAGTNNIYVRWFSSILIPAVSPDSVGTEALQSQSVTTAKWAHANGAIGGFRNLLVNGNFIIRQRGPAGMSNAWSYGPDRWQVYRTGGAAGFAMGSITPFGQVRGLLLQRNPGTSGLEDITAANTLEQSATRRINGKTVTLSFGLARGQHFSGANNAVTVRVFGGTGVGETFYLTPFTSPTVLASKSVVIPDWFGAPVINDSITFNVPNGIGQCAVVFSYTPTGIAGAQDWFIMTYAQLEEGASRTPFEYRPEAVELALCQKYFERATQSYAGSAWTAGAQFAQWVPFKVPKLGLGASITTFGAALTNVSSIVYDNVSKDGYRVVITPTAQGPWQALTVDTHVSLAG